MAIVATDIQYRLSGGAANASLPASLGGAKSSTTLTTAESGGAHLFDDVSEVESAGGDAEYRCVYVHNGHATLTMLGSRVFVAANTPHADTTIDVGVGTAAVNGAEQTVANETTAPSGVAFSAPADYATGLALGDIPPGQHKAIWIRRTVNAGAAASASDTFSFTVQCNTLA